MDGCHIREITMEAQRSDLEAKYISKVGLTELAVGLDVWHQRKTSVKDDSYKDDSV